MTKNSKGTRDKIVVVIQRCENGYLVDLCDYLGEHIEKERYVAQDSDEAGTAVEGIVYRAYEGE